MVCPIIVGVTFRLQDGIVKLTGFRETKPPMLSVQMKSRYPYVSGLSQLMMC